MNCVWGARLGQRALLCCLLAAARMLKVMSWSYRWSLGAVIRALYSSCCGLSVGVSVVVGRVLVVEVATASAVSMTRSIMCSKRSYITPFALGSYYIRSRGGGDGSPRCIGLRLYERCCLSI